MYTSLIWDWVVEHWARPVSQMGSIGMFLEQVRSLATAAACSASATTLHHEALRFRIDRRNRWMFGADQTEINAWIAWERWARRRPTPTRTADLPCFSKSRLPFRKPYHMFQASLTFSNDLHTSPSFSKFYAIDSRALHPVTVICMCAWLTPGENLHRRGFQQKQTTLWKAQHA